MQQHEKPAYVRVWLSASYQKDGEQLDKVSGSFLENRESPIATGLSGKVKTRLPIKISVPEFTNWLDYAKKVILHIAILKKNVNKPYKILSGHIIAEDRRELGYTR